MPETNAEQNEIVAFIRRRDYKLVKELGQGACGKTVLLFDEQINEHFVCKKFVPYSETRRQELFSGFVREIKLLHQVHHNNVVRVFNYYLYPDQYTGYILMEYVQGAEIDDHLKEYPEQTNELFLQAVSGFAYLEQRGILHRDIRPGNLMVRTDGILKIIDLGFGKQIQTSTDFEKSVSLNWWCDPPNDFGKGRYDFATEVYFVGKLFERILQENKVSHFKYSDTLEKMCAREPSLRFQCFSEIEKTIRSDQFFEIDFREEELDAYREFTNSLCRQVTKLESGTKYVDDIERIRTQLEDVYRKFMLEPYVPDASLVINCFIAGSYRYYTAGLVTADVKGFLRLLKTSSYEKNRVILANLHTRLDTVARYDANQVTDEDIPF
ncbi:MAG: serine/threonine-protein kinase [Terriglobia bacterium]